MIVRDVIEANQHEDSIFIEYRTNSPFEGQEDMLFGAASYEKGQPELISEDGDNYSINDEIYKYEWRVGEDDSNYLVVWFESIWDSSETYIRE